MSDEVNNNGSDDDGDDSDGDYDGDGGDENGVVVMMVYVRSKMMKQHIYSIPLKHVGGM